jgi:hypothetical protein
LAISYEKMASGVKIVEANIGMRLHNHEAKSDKRLRLKSAPRTDAPVSRARARAIGQPEGDVRFSRREEDSTAGWMRSGSHCRHRGGGWSSYSYGACRGGR